MEKTTEGSLYKTITVEDITLNIYYGYYSEKERNQWEPTPIFPDFEKNPLFTKNGDIFVRADQDVCEHYKPKPIVSDENWCNDCKSFKLLEEIIGLCNCDKRKTILRQNE